MAMKRVELLLSVAHGRGSRSLKLRVSGALTLPNGPGKVYLTVWQQFVGHVGSGGAVKLKICSKRKCVYIVNI